MNSNFVKLYGKEREIVLEIHDMLDDVAIKHLYEKYSDERGKLTIMNELKSLAEKGYVRGTVESKTGIPGIKNILGNLRITILPDCKNYLEMEKDNISNQHQANINIHGDVRNSNIVGGNATNVTQSINVDAAKENALEILTTMKNLVAVASIDDDTKKDVIDDIDIITEQIESATPKESRIKKVMQSIKTALMPIKHIATVSTVLEHLNKLASFVEQMLQTGGA